MIDLQTLLSEGGFDACYVLPSALAAEDTGNVKTLLLFIKTYVPEKENACPQVHPYYYAAQQAYTSATSLAKMMKKQGINAVHLPDVRVKPLLARCAGVNAGRNTLDYIPKYGSRFHVQTIGVDVDLPSSPLQDTMMDFCGDCQRCMTSCPGGAIRADGFHREDCLRFHMLNGKETPDCLKEKMGGRLLGCDVCQAVCPHNAPVIKDGTSFRPLEELLCLNKQTVRPLGDVLGYNLANHNRITAQACLNAGNSFASGTVKILQELSISSSKTVSAHAAWALNKLQSGKKDC